MEQKLMGRVFRWLRLAGIIARLQKAMILSNVRIAAWVWTGGNRKTIHSEWTPVTSSCLS